MVTRVCQHCNQSYETFPSIRLMFCSQKCSSASRVKYVIVECAQCGAPTKRHRSARTRFCSKGCARTARNLTDENPSFSRDISGEKNPMFGKGMRGAENPMFGKTGAASPNWKGGRRPRPDGYSRIAVPHDHPYPSDVKGSGTKYVLEHRRVMELHLGRYLLPVEVVHHIDGNPRNNSIENLELFASKSDHLRLRHGKNAH